MARCIAVSIVAAGALLAIAGAATADQCPALVHAIYALAGTRFDQAAYDAREKAAQAARLHAEGRHQDAEKIAFAGCTLLGVERCRSHATR
jgi:hypothetical protein